MLAARAGKCPDKVMDLMDGGPGFLKASQILILFPLLSLTASLQDQHLGGCQREKRAWEGGRESLKGPWLCAFHLLHGAVTDITSSLWDRSPDLQDSGESDSPFLPPCPACSTYPHAHPGRLGRPGRAEWVARGCSWEREESARTPSPQPQRKCPHEPELDPASWGREATLWAGLPAWHHLGPQDLVVPLLFVPAPWPLCPA